MRAVFNEHDDETGIKKRNTKLAQKMHELVATIQQELVHTD